MKVKMDPASRAHRALVQDDATGVASVPQPPPLAAVAGEPLRSQRKLTKHGDEEGGKGVGGMAHGLMIKQRLRAARSLS